MTKKTETSAFTLIELLICITILAILAAILLPALSRAKYIAKTAECISNLKQVGLAYTNYTGDFDLWYPTDECQKYGSDDSCLNACVPRYGRQTRPTRATKLWRTDNDHHKHYRLINDYIGGHSGFVSTFMCPHLEPGYRQWYDDKGWGNFDKNYPLKNNGTVPFTLFYGAGGTDQTNGIAEPMFRLGRKWQNGNYARNYTLSRKKWSNVLASDVMGEDRHYKRGNTRGSHPGFGSNYEFYSRSNAFYQDWSFWGKGNANYLLTDGSVHHYEGIDYHNYKNDLGGHMWYGIIPLEFFSDDR